MNILKFGGTSVGSAQSISALMDILIKGKHAEHPIVVLSAMGGVTNTLLDMAESARKGEDYAETLKKVEDKHFEVIRALLPASAQNPVLTKLKIYLNELEDILQAVYNLKELSLQTKDLILSYGERCSTMMVSHIARQYFANALFVDGSELIKTDHNFGQAKVNTELTENLIRDFYAGNNDKLLFVTGFISSNDEGRITTLGRGGSDYTAAIWGAALGADEIEIWTDVDGMLTADPRIVKKAFSLPELSYTEAMELSYFGAKVIYPPTMIPAFLKKIPIVIKNTFNVDFPGTYIRHNVHASSLPIKGISSIDEISILNLSGSGMVGKAGFSGRLFSMLSREQVNVVLITQSSSEHSITFAVKPADALKALALINKEFELELQARKLEYPEVENGLSVLAIVGENMKRTPGISGRLFSALGRNGVNIRAIAQGSSEYNISVILSRSDLSKAVNAVHDAFYADLKKTLNVFCLGTGNIGKTLFKQLQHQMPFLAKNNDLQVKVMGVSNTRKMYLDAEGIDLNNWEDTLNEKGEQADLAEFIKKMKSMNLANCVFVDNTASHNPIRHYLDVLQSSISVVTCNKIGNSAEYDQYVAFKEAARKHGVEFYYETNVGAGLPIIRTLKDLMLSGDRINRIEAILSGTISYIFNNFKGDRLFSEVVKEAQDMGYTEPDPRDDLNGKDFMRKMLILARDAGYALEEKDVAIESMLPPACLAASSVAEFYQELENNAAHFENLKNEAAKSNKVLRYIGKLEDGKVAITLQMVDDSHPFYMLSGSDNIISFTTDRYKERPLVVKGPGAGAEVTAAGVFADIINIGKR
ncbi:bifunctional aspartate kinase/homoserine dehydrogenase I [Pedobacter heparinus]|uniref:Aspartate kinase n=1 Tax=Pedobacter heparinus (strain ATCC 13125 / DSM 2366 / CIP 104194 / JCM 7457 / NBRC 12017 / NCIMB 9290 / NRRL B-14731 / HIM 762-3) TaxID=485917 RepID=C6XUY7_PEDHD|nr:bifunctional aspartate kinase/homoserine dehydrogenase I [Pedobacter heparinus]ACU05995.1 aspartate kinase [Pedobacter heparinus DSM 2366]